MEIIAVYLLPPTLSRKKKKRGNLLNVQKIQTSPAREVSHSEQGNTSGLMMLMASGNAGERESVCMCPS